MQFSKAWEEGDKKERHNSSKEVKETVKYVRTYRSAKDRRTYSNILTYSATRKMLTGSSYTV